MLMDMLYTADILSAVVEYGLYKPIVSKRKLVHSYPASMPNPEKTVQHMHKHMQKLLSTRVHPYRYTRITSQIVGHPKRPGIFPSFKAIQNIF
jgi:hypothetical protein